MNKNTKDGGPEIPSPPESRGHPRVVNTGLAREFEQRLRQDGKTDITVRNYLRLVRRFLRFIGGESQLASITEDTVGEFFRQIKGKRRDMTSVVGQFLRFAAMSQPALIQPDDKSPSRSSDMELAAIQQGWALDRLKQQKESADDTIAKLGRKLIDHFLYFQSRLRGDQESVEELARLAADCRELIHSNLDLILTLSASGRNVHTLIDERVNHESRRVDQKVRRVSDR